MNNKINTYLSHHSDFSTEDFFIMLQQDEPDIGRSTVYKLLKELCDQNIITRTGRGKYNSFGRSEYQYQLSNTAKKLSLKIQKEYPLVDFRIWELYQMNEFLNHQMAHNTIIVDVEDELDETVFNFLFEKYPHVLFCPSYEEYYRYTGNQTIVVKKLISEAPSCDDRYHLAPLEKILVDLFGKGISGAIIPKSEYPVIFEESFQKYNINTAMMFRYARRRGCEKKVKEFTKVNTGLDLEKKK